MIFLRSSKVTDEDFDKEVKRIMTVKNIEKNDSTLKEYIIGKSGHIKQGKDKKIRTAFYCVTVFDFKKEECKIKKYVIDLFEESVVLSEYVVPVGCTHKIIEKTYDTAIGGVQKSFLAFNDDDEIAIPVNMNVYDTDAVIKRITHKR